MDEGRIRVSAHDASRPGPPGDTISEHAFESIAESLTDAVISATPTGTVLTWSAGAEQLFGMPAGRVVGRKLWDLVSAELREPTQVLFVAVCRERQRVRLEGEMHRADGSTFWAENSSAPIVADDGEIRGLASVIRDMSRARELELELRRSEARARSVLETAVDGIITIDRDGIVQSINRSGAEMFGYEVDDVVGRNVSMLAPEPHRERHTEYIRRYLDTGEARIIGIGREEYAQRKDGTRFPIYLAVSEVRTEEGPLFTGIVRDLTERKQAEELFDSFFNWSSDLLAVRDLDGTFVRVNATWERVLGHSHAELEGAPLERYVHPDDLEATRRELQRARESDEPVVYENRYRHRDGSYRRLGWSVRAQTGTGRVYAIARDVTDQRAAEEELAYRANHDALTAVMNRPAFRIALEQAVRKARRHGRRGALLYVDLDGFKEVNDRGGHEAGDRVLQEVSARLAVCVRDVDTVARLGGDEFAVLLDEIHHESEVRAVADRLLRTLDAAPFRAGGYEITIGASIGFVVFPDDGDDIDALIARADVAMYESKRAGGRSPVRYSSRVAEAAIREQRTE